MEEQILKEILVEMKGIRQDLSGTNQRLDRLEQTTNIHFESLEQTTNNRFESLEQTTNNRFESLEQTTNNRFDSLEQTTNNRFERLESKFDSLEQTTNNRFERLENKIIGLHSSLVVMQQGFADMRRDISGIKEILAEKVIWQNDNILIESKEGIVAEGIIRHLSRK